jgi:pimeloyl-ACP methyl ester carboxylesterase
LTRASRLVARSRGRVGLIGGIAVAAAASAALIALRSRQAERRHPASGGMLEVDGVRLHYVDRGSGPAVVLLHGNGSLVDELRTTGVLERAAERYRVIAFDRPGFGHSERPRTRIWGPEAQARLLWHALDRLGVERPVILGHSWGDFVALHMALERPTAVVGLVLASGYYFASPRLDVPLLSGPAIPIVGDLVRWTVSPWLGRLMWPLLLARIFGPAAVPERFRREIDPWMLLRPGQIRAAAAESAMMIPATLALRRRYAELRLPVRVLAGEGDRHVNWQQSRRLAETLPRAELQVTPGAGHMLLHAAPDEVLAAIDAVVGAAARDREERVPGSASPALATQDVDGGPAAHLS